jgi:hypothetical protein
MPWTPNDAERHTRKAASSGRKSPTNAWNGPTTTVARSGKQMLWSHDRWKPAYTENFGNFCRFFFVSQGITSKRIHQGKNLTASFVAPGT